jgi:hypothetical protein
MTVGELIEYLEDFDQEAEVKIAYQPGWPLENVVGQVNEANGDVYIVVSTSHTNNYAPHGVFEEY